MPTQDLEPAARLRSYGIPAVVLAMGIAATLFGWRVSHRLATERHRDHFQILADNTVHSIRDRLIVCEDALRGCAGLFHASDAVDRLEWRRFVESVRPPDRYFGVTGAGFVAYVPGHLRESFLMSTRADAAPGFEITPPGERPEHFVVTYLEPTDREGTALGYDIATEAVRKAAAERARDTGETSLTGSIVLRQDRTRSPGFLLLLPVYRPDQPLGTIEERRRALIGWVDFAFVGADMLRNVAESIVGNVSFDVYEGPVADPQHLIYDRRGSGSPPEGNGMAFSESRPMEFGGRTWTVVLSATGESVYVFTRRVDALVIAAGMAISIALFGWTVSRVRSESALRRAHEALEARVSQRTRQLTEANRTLEGAILKQRSAEAQLSRQALLFNNLYDAVILTDARGLISDVNPSAERIFGYAGDELLGRNPEMLNPLEEGPRVTELIRRAIAERQAWSGELRFRRRDGTEGWCETRATPLYDADGRWLGTLAVNRDVTERRRTEEALVERAMHTALSADVGIALTECEPLPQALQQCAEALVSHLGAAFARIWTFEESESLLVLQASAGLYTHLDGAHSRIALGQLKIGWIAQERRAHMTNAVVEDSQINDQQWARREGMTSFAGHPLVVEDRLVGVAAVFARHPLSEATLEALTSVADAIAVGIERKRTETALRENRRLLQDILDNSPAVIYFKDAEGRYILINRRYEELFHVTRGQMTGKTDHDCFSKEIADAFRANDRAVLTAGAPLEWEEVAPHDDGPHTYISLKFPLHDAAGRAYGVCGISTDITERKRSEESERRHHAELAHASRLGLMGTMVAQLVHELSQPIAALDSFSSGGLQVLDARGMHDPELRRALEGVRSAAQRGSQTVQRLKEFIRKRPPSRESVDLNVAIREAAGFIDGEVKRRKVRLRLELAPRLPTIVGDRILIQQVLLNLAVNSLQAMESDPPDSSELTLRTSPRADGHIEIAVIDTGGGVAPEIVDKLFMPYFTTKPHGLGMGLSISRSIVESLGGRLWMEPNHPRGTVFRIRLSIALPDSPGPTPNIGDA